MGIDFTVLSSVIAELASFDVILMLLAGVIGGIFLGS